MNLFPFLSEILQTTKSDELIKKKMSFELSKILTAIFLTGIICFSLYQNITYINSLDHNVVSDMRGYYKSAQKITTAGHFWPIGYPFTLSIVFKIFEPSPRTAYLFNAFLSAGSTILIFCIGLALAGRVAGVIGGFLFAFSQESLIWTGLMLTETLQSTLYLLLIALTIRISKKKSSLLHSVFLGLTLGLAALTKSLLLVLIFPTMLSLSITGISNRTLKEKVIKWGPAVLIMFGVIMGYGVFNTVVHKRFVPLASNGPINFYIGNNVKANGLTSGARARINFPPGTPAKEQEQAYMRSALEFRKNFPKKVRQLNFIRIMNWWTSNPNQDGLFAFVKAQEKTKNLFLVPSGKILLWGMPCIFLFLCLSAGQLAYKDANKTHRMLLTALMSCALFSACVYMFTQTLLGTNISIIVYFLLVAFCSFLSMAVIASFFFLEQDVKRLQLLTRLSLPIGIIAFSAVYTLYFFVKIRFRFPLIPFYCIILGICVQDLFHFTVNRLPSRKLQNSPPDKQPNIQA